MIQLKNLTKIYGNTKAVDNLSIEFNQGKIIGFIGPNGAGKTTTLKMMTGIVTPTSGEVIMNGFNVADHPIEAKKQFGFVFDSPDSFLSLKGIEFIDFMAQIYEVPAKLRNERLVKYAELFKMSDVLNDKIESYSHGMRQKIMIIGALIHEPTIWLLDEPLTGLDPQSSFDLKTLMKEHVNKGNTVVFSTHVLEVAEKLCDEIILISQGQLKYNGSLEHLKEIYPDKTLEEIFLEVTHHE